MKSNLPRRLFAGVLALVLSVGLLGTGALAAGTVNEAKEKTGNDGQIVVTVYDQAPGDAGTGAQVSSGLSNPVEGVGINALRIGSVVELTSTDGSGTVSTQVAFGLSNDMVTLLGLSTEQAIASKDTTHYFEPAVVQAALSTANKDTIESTLNGASNKINQVTGSDGAATFTGLNYGLYLLAKSALPADATTDLVPFLVSVPMYVESTSGDAWQSTVYAYPKVRTADITISKTVDDTDIYVNAGQTLQYTVTTTIPAAATGNGTANEFTSFVITDTNTDSTLNIDKSTVVVKLGDDALACTPAYDGSVLTLTLTTEDLAALNAHLSQNQTITVTYDATVATDVTFASKITNTAKATYQRDGMTGTADATVAANASNTVDLYTYGIDLTKTLSDSGTITPSTISFALYTDETCTDANKIPVVSGNGGYWKAAAEETTPVVMCVGTDGHLKLYGLEPGTYYLKETATMDGYTLLAQPITIFIADENHDGTATATVNGANARVTDGVVSLTVENTRNTAGFTLPQTGGAGTLMVTAIGLGLLWVGVILLVVYRRKGQKNS